jgi:hypothetical protein
MALDLNFAVAPASRFGVIGHYFRSQCFALVSCMQSTFGGPLRNVLHFLTCPLHPPSKVRNLYLKSSLFPSSARDPSLFLSTESDHVDGGGRCYR